ncbi:hypothetical protein CEQ07_05125 [Oligella urethralis]|nr:hypothetical protein CEQ07_05125 [Oligella urethralis]
MLSKNKNLISSKVPISSKCHLELITLINSGSQNKFHKFHKFQLIVCIDDCKYECLKVCKRKLICIYMYVRTRARNLWNLFAKPLNMHVLSSKTWLELNTELVTYKAYGINAPGGGHA